MSSFFDQNELIKLGLGSFGANVYISKYANLYNASAIHLGSNIRIDDFCILSAGKEGIHIDNYVHIGCYSSLIGQAKISVSSFANISTKVSIFSSSDDFSGFSLTNPMINDNYKLLNHAPVTIDKHVIIGTNSTVLPGVHLEKGSAVGAHSLIKNSSSPFQIYAGVPARRVGSRSDNITNLEKKFLKNEQNFFY